LYCIYALYHASCVRRLHHGQTKLYHQDCHCSVSHAIYPSARLFRQIHTSRSFMPNQTIYMSHTTSLLLLLQHVVQIRVAKVCLVLQKVHPLLEKLAATARYKVSSVHSVSLISAGTRCMIHMQVQRCSAIAELTYRPTVSESPITHKCLFGRVIATMATLVSKERIEIAGLDSYHLVVASRREIRLHALHCCAPG
jgi:hypothetical protein